LAKGADHYTTTIERKESFSLAGTPQKSNQGTGSGILVKTKEKKFGEAVQNVGPEKAHTTIWWVWPKKSRSSEAKTRETP
jgi:hypothetical protein